MFYWIAIEEVLVIHRLLAGNPLAERDASPCAKGAIPAARLGLALLACLRLHVDDGILL